MGNRHGQPETSTSPRTTLSPTDSTGRKISSASAASAPFSSNRSPFPSRNPSNDSPSISEANSIKRRQKFSVGECSTPPPEALSQRLSTSRKHFSQKSDHKLLQLTDSEKLCLQQSWKTLISHHPSFIHEVWTAAIDRSPSIKATFLQYSKKKFGRARSADHQDSNEVFEAQSTDMDGTDDARFRSLTKTIHDFFHQLVMVDQLNYNSMKSSCQALGIRHKAYSQHGYQPVFFDIFTVCFLDRLEMIHEEVRLEFPPIKQTDAAVNDYWKVMTNASGAEDSKEEINNKALMAWQKFMRMVADMMREGYMKSEAPNPATNVDVVVTGSSP